LSDAIPPANRQNLVNPNGETYPVGVYISNYAASFAAQYLGAAIIEEVLGYNTVLNTDALGSGSVAGYYSVTGCRDPNNVADRGCMQGVTYYHVHFESWYGYPSDWANIRKAYPSMAPKNLGSMGYDGFTSIYIPKPIQEQAYATEGLALQYYRSYNSSWHDPAKYFGLISSVDTSKLMPCTASVMSDDAAMRRHVQFTNDQDGVVISNDDAMMVFGGWLQVAERIHLDASGSSQEVLVGEQKSRCRNTWRGTCLEESELQHHGVTMSRCLSQAR